MEMSMLNGECWRMWGFREISPNATFVAGCFLGQGDRLTASGEKIGHSKSVGWKGTDMRGSSQRKTRWWRRDAWSGLDILFVGWSEGVAMTSSGWQQDVEQPRRSDGFSVLPGPVLRLVWLVTGFHNLNAISAMKVGIDRSENKEILGNQIRQINKIVDLAKKTSNFSTNQSQPLGGHSLVLQQANKSIVFLIKYSKKLHNYWS